jgi:sulfatase modifying factor 1
MASLTCPDCGTDVPWTASGCAGCGATFRELRCASCMYTGLADRFVNEHCPKCGKDRLKIVPQSGADVDEVGAEAFVDGTPLLEDLERSFSKPRDRKRPADTPPTEKSKRPEDKPHASPDSDPRPVLKRQRWGSSANSDPETLPKKNEPEPKKPIVKSTKQELVPDRHPQRFKLELSPKGQQLLKWSAMGLPLVLILVLGIVWLGNRAGRRGQRPIANASNAVDPTALEAQALALYNAAAAYYQSGKTEESIATLQQVVSQFPLTSAGMQARQALDRVNHGQPPFDGPASGATTPAPPPTAPAEQPPTPDAPKKKAYIGVRTKPAAGEGGTSDGAGGTEGSTATPNPPPGAPPPGSTLAKANVPPRALPDGFVAVNDAGVHSSGWPIEVICLKDLSHMMLVPAGEFEMGSSAGESNAKPPHRVRLKAYYVDRYEITASQYSHFLEQRRLKKNPYRELSPAAANAAPTERHPVVGVAWRDANAYAEWSGKTLPTEAQWEKAARGGDTRLVPWGTGEPKWEKPRAPKEIDRVGSFAWDVSPYGCFDMASNAWEWCSDWYDPIYYNSNVVDDPEGPTTAPPPIASRDVEKVLRGGAANWDVTWRGFAGIQDEPLHAGFRCVLEVERVAPRAATGVVTEAPKAAQPQVPTRVPPGGYKF